MNITLTSKRHKNNFLREKVKKTDKNRQKEITRKRDFMVLNWSEKFFKNTIVLRKGSCIFKNFLLETNLRRGQLPGSCRAAAGQLPFGFTSVRCFSLLRISIYRTKHVGKIFFLTVPYPKND